MSKFNEAKQKAIAKALGSNRTFPVKKLKLGSPLAWLNLAHEIKGRLISTGGRPSDPYWDTKRQVPFRKKVWGYLTYVAKELSYQGRKVGPAQLAAIIIEDKVRQPMTGSSELKIEIKLESSIGKYVHETKAIDPGFVQTESTSQMNSPEIFKQTSASSKQEENEGNFNFLFQMEENHE